VAGGGQPVDRAPIDDRIEVEAFGNGTGVYAFAKALPHLQRFVGCLDR
jgi:hypothetical protein